MGASIGAALRVAGHDVSWVEAERSGATKQRALAAELRSVPLLEEGLANSEIVISVCPPEFAFSQAQAVKELGYQRTYVDANAVSPGAAASIADLFGDQYVDGGIIGPPAWRAGTTRLYLSGLQSQEIADLFQGTLVGAIDLGDQPATASAVKMCYASYTKGTTALLLALRAVAEFHGVTDALLAEWGISQPDLERRSTNAAPGTSRKGWRFVSEMNEISKTYEGAGLPGEFHKAAAEVYRRMAVFKDKDPASLSEVMDTLIEAGTQSTN